MPFRHAELVSASVQTCIVSLFFLTFIFSFCVLQAKREGAEAGGLRAGGSRNAVYGDRVRQKKTNQNTLKSILIRTARILAYDSSKERNSALSKELLKSLYENFRSQRNRTGTPYEAKPNPVPM